MLEIIENISGKIRATIQQLNIHRVYVCSEWLVPMQNLMLYYLEMTIQNNKKFSQLMGMKLWELKQERDWD